ncbi:MAG TPA: DUF5808 domain-containing protein [Steroidobacteraceae bacterium]|nr:DUF5808 domain-containing protein [Steroidobacteraceae bacterium]
MNVPPVDHWSSPGRYLTWIALLPVLSLAILGVWSALHFGDLPARITVHWNLNGPDGWVRTSPRTIAAFVGGFAAICLVLAALAWVLCVPRLVVSGGTGEDERQFRRRTAGLLLICAYFIACVPWFSLLEAPAAVLRIWGLCLVIAIIGGVIGLMVAAQRAQRSFRAAQASQPQTQRERWKWGVFYFDRTDPAVLVPKRFGVGYTFNFGNGWAWVLLAAILVLPGALFLLLMR